uniref:PiggyBac2 n=1 Tax=Dichotomius schiffleri TaxID=1534479 RepID=A0A7S8IXR8_9SCAR|nr:PiggyBac2 [Dichotomius schiffleri]
MLWGFRGRCSFRQYMRNKPAKYGIKVFSLVDARTFYVANMEIYLGRQPEGLYKILQTPAEVVTRLITPINKSGRNVTHDNWFTSIPLAHKLLHDHNLTTVGTVRKNKKELPERFTNSRDRHVNSSLFGFGKNNTTLVSYVPKKGRVVVLLSTMHNSKTIDPDSGDAKKPEIITFYNTTKGGVDVVDEMCSTYSTARKTNRWPLTAFFHLLDVILSVICQVTKG